MLQETQINKEIGVKANRPASVLVRILQDQTTLLPMIGTVGPHKQNCIEVSACWLSMDLNLDETWMKSDWERCQQKKNLYQAKFCNIEKLMSYQTARSKLVTSIQFTVLHNLPFHEHFLRHSNDKEYDNGKDEPWSSIYTKSISVHVASTKTCWIWFCALRLWLHQLLSSLVRKT